MASPLRPPHGAWVGATMNAVELVATRYRRIIFDADGTLFDFEHAERSALTRTLGDFGIRLPELLRVVDG